MSRYVDADALIELGLQDGAYEYISVQEVAKQPTADVRKNIYGEWIHDKSNWKYRFLCSKCGYKLIGEKPTNFCPNCGADMRGDRNE